MHWRPASPGDGFEAPRACAVESFEVTPGIQEPALPVAVVAAPIRLSNGKPVLVDSDLPSSVRFQLFTFALVFNSCMGVNSAHAPGLLLLLFLHILQGWAVAQVKTETVPEAERPSLVGSSQG